MEIKPQPGDNVEIELMKISYKGTLLQSPESEKGIVLLKLSSGYNLGIIKKEIREIKILKKYHEQAKEETEIKKDKEKLRRPWDGPDLG